MEYKDYIERIEFKADQENLKIFGYASIFNIEDNYGDIIEKGAFESSISDPSNIKFLWQHDPKIPIGKINKLYEDENGLFIEANINSNLALGRDASILIKDKVIDGLSIGFTINKSTLSKSGNRIIKDLKLWEISLVTFPANNLAKISQINVKNISFSLEKISKSINQLKRSFYGRNYR